VTDSIQMTIDREKWALAPPLRIVKHWQGFDMLNRLTIEPGRELLLDSIEA